MRTWGAVRLGKLAAWSSRRLGVGDGAIIGGRVAMALDHRALAKLSRGRRVVLVTGTNGKTTSTLMITEALRSLGAVATNTTGANMPDGHLSALMGAPNTPYVVLEVDELHLEQVAAQTNPSVIVLLNLSRDQLDRVGEIRGVERLLRKVVTDNPDAAIVANCDDPYIVSAALEARQVSWVAAGSRWIGDALVCPRCGLAMRDDVCECGLARPNPDWAAHGDLISGPGGYRRRLRLGIPGEVNLANAAIAMAAVSRLGCPPDRAADRIETITQVAGRYAIYHYDQRPARLILAKNPSSWTEAIELARAEDQPVVLAVNSREADGTDMSWLWDVEFERLAGKDVTVTGERATDLAVRLRYAHVGFASQPDPVRAITGSEPGRPNVLANYTAFQSIRARGRL